jgi:serine acetyltransferase
MSSFLADARADVNRWLGAGARGTRRKLLRVILREVGLQAVLVYRFGRLLRAGNGRPWTWPLLPLGWLCYAPAAFIVRKGYGIRLSLTADIGTGFWIGHFGGIEVVNCRIGERCSVGQQTKVGRTGEPNGPQIGAGVWIGPHARICGPVTVGDGATIAPSARVTRNVPCRALIVGDPGRVVFRGYDNRGILHGG